MESIASSPSVKSQDSKDGLSPEQKRDLVQRVIRSQAFHRTPAMRAFLLYITENEILGKADKLKEQCIGTEVLGRPVDYNPTDDNIVRVRAHELRARLERYFTTEGTDEPFVITMPRGAYAPEFVPRQSAAAESHPEAEAEVLAEELDANPPASLQLSRRHWLAFGGMLAAAILVSVLVTRYAVLSGVRPGFARPSGAVHDFWGQLFQKPGDEIKIVYADTSFALWQDLNGKTMDLGDYLNRKYYDSQDNHLFNVVLRRVTSPADMALSVHLTTLAAEFGGHTRPEFARDADSEFFHLGSVVLIGSHRSNPWVGIYEPALNFVLDQDPHSGAPMFRNRSPQANEASAYAIPAMYDTQTVEERTYTSYGVIALLKGCSSHGYTVLVEGLNTQATQAAGDFVTDPQRLDTLLSSIGHRPGTNVAPFEALFQITSLPGGYDDPKVVAYRLRSPEACVGG